jgi:L-methionine (R)-S-oxide reductase
VSSLPDLPARHACILQAASAPGAPEAVVAATMQALARELPWYEWVGVYVLRGGVLELGPYVGKPTEHTRIPVGRGVCGTAVAQQANQIIEDVLKLDNYIACADSVRSEIVVLVWHEGEIVGQIDADCDQVGAFTAEDEALLTQVAAALSPHVAALASRE